MTVGAFISGAIEPVLREGLERMGVAGPGGPSGVVGGNCTRNDDPEIDRVVADRSPIATAVTAVGSITWLESAPFDSHDLGQSVVHRTQLPGATADTPLVAVSRNWFAVDGVIRVTPKDIISAWPGERSTHVLNAVSPAWTSALVVARYVIESSEI